MLLLALSCLQGRPTGAAAEELLSLGPDGLQLTPGNAPTEGAVESMQERGVSLYRHHGWTDKALRQRVWGEAGQLLVASDSVHPPRSRHPAIEAWTERFDAGELVDTCLETMHPGYALGDGESLERAMDLGQRLAVDVSHLYIQRCQGLLQERSLQRLWNYEHILEVHLSANDGRYDKHQPISRDTFGLAWALEKAGEGTPIILECYMHSLSDRERRQQLDLLLD